MTDLQSRCDPLTACLANRALLVDQPQKPKWRSEAVRASAWQEFRNSCELCPKRCQNKTNDHAKTKMLFVIGPYFRTNSRSTQRHRPLLTPFKCVNCCHSSFFGDVLSFCSLLATASCHALLTVVCCCCIFLPPRSLLSELLGILHPGKTVAVKEERLPIAGLAAKQFSNRRLKTSPKIVVLPLSGCCSGSWSPAGGPEKRPAK